MITLQAQLIFLMLYNLRQLYVHKQRLLYETVIIGEEENK